MYYIYGISGSSLLIESTDSMIIEGEEYVKYSKSDALQEVRLCIACRQKEDSIILQKAGQK